MYPNLNAELARKGWTKKVLAIKINKRYATLIDKLNGKTDITYQECLAIKSALGTDLSVETLFFTH